MKLCTKTSLYSYNFSYLPTAIFPINVGFLALSYGLLGYL